MQTMTRVSAVAAEVFPPMDGSFNEEDRIYENVRLSGPDMEKLVALCDALLFYCAVARLRTHPVTITEAEGCVNIGWTRYAPAVFRKSRMLDLSAGGEHIDYLTVQESRVA